MGTSAPERDSPFKVGLGLSRGDPLRAPPDRVDGLGMGRLPWLRIWRVLGFSLFLGGTLGLPPAVFATGPMAKQMGYACIRCHLDAYGHAGLNDQGLAFRAGGMRYAFDRELAAPGEPAPLSEGGARLLMRRMRNLGERIFSYPGLGRNSNSCASCHAQGKGLSEVWKSHPKFRPELGRWITLEGAIQDCLVKNLGAEPLVTGSRSSVALQTYLKTVTEKTPGIFEMASPELVVEPVEAEEPAP